MDRSKFAHPFGRFSFIAVTAMLFVFGISYIQAAFTFPTVNPSGGNVAVPINLSNVFQDKAAGLEAGTLAVSNGITLNGLNRTTAEGWPTSATTTIASCRLEVRRVDTTAKRFYSIVGAPVQYQKCDDYLTPEARAAGWAHSGGDNCTTVISSDCDGATGVPSSCVYTRVICSSNLPIAVPVTSTSTYTTNPVTISTFSTTTVPFSSSTAAL